MLSTGLTLTLLTLPMACLAVLVGYVGLQWMYCVRLKHIAVVDVAIIALGFVLRVLMGGVAIDVTVTGWMLSAVFLLTLFLGFAKRYHEMVSQSGSRIRKSLAGYTRRWLVGLMGGSCGASLLCYLFYVQDMVVRTGVQGLYLTVIFVAFGLGRYLRYVVTHGGGGEPEAFVFSDTFFILNGLVWLVLTLWLLGK